MENNLEEKMPQIRQFQKVKKKKDPPVRREVRKYTKTEKPCKRWTNDENIAYAEFLMEHREDF